MQALHACSACGQNRVSSSPFEQLFHSIVEVFGSLDVFYQLKKIS